MGSRPILRENSCITRHMLNNRGSATILMLLVSMVIVTIAIGFNWLVKSHLTAAEGFRKKSEAMLNAMSAFDSLMYSGVTGTIGPRDIVFSTRPDVLGAQTIPLDGTPVDLPRNVRVRLQDANGLLSLARLDENAMQRLIKVVRPQEAGSVIITDSLLDWIDPDRFQRPNGAEEMFYRMADRPYAARNYALQYKEELGFIRGMDPELYRKISPHTTLLPNFGFNPNTASDEVLMAYLAIDNDAVKKLRDYMRQRPVVSDTALFGLTGRTIASDVAGVYFFPVKLLEVTVSSGKPRPYYTIRAGVDLRQNTISPYNVVYWNEE